MKPREPKGATVSWWNRTSIFAARSLALLPALVLLRIYEYALVRHRHALPNGAVRAMLTGLPGDVALTLFAALALCVPVLAIAAWRDDVAERVHRVFLVLIVLVHVALIHYLGVTFVPLGADVFGYSLHDISVTVRGSTSLGLSAMVPFAAAGWFMWFASGQARQFPLHALGTAGFMGAIGIAIVVPRLWLLAPRDFAEDTAYFLAVNPTVHLAVQAVQRARASGTSSRGEAFTGYPLLHRADAPDVLGPLLRLGDTPPNIVIIVVEGLGRDFVGDGARYGGFTPFIDSLTHQSLYWDNFLSTSGRTFGVLPALLASLPHVDGGFLQLGARMPRHLSLPGLLKARGYTTRYFTGTDGHFDMIDVFLERQGMDSIIDASAFGPGYERQPASEGGVSWGFGDDQLFRRVLASGPAVPVRPTLDIYLTITTHEPFLPPRPAEYATRFERRLAAPDIDEGRRAEYRTYAGVFESLLYLDDALRTFMAAYARRPDYARTIFLITGDHRLIPIPPASRLDRYRVPFLIYSPLVREPRRFSSVSSHLDVTPSLLALLQGHAGLSFPDSVPWLGTGIDTATAFRNVHALDLMRTTGQMDEYLDGTVFLSGDDLFTVDDHLGLAPASNATVQASTRAKLDRARALGRYVTSHDRIIPGTGADAAAVQEGRAADSAFAALGLTGQTPDSALRVARTHALARDYVTAQLIARKLLRDAPNHHDARALLGRTYAWQRKFDEARPILTELVRRAPDYLDGRLALIDMDIWSGQSRVALTDIAAALQRFPGNADIAARQRRALDLARTPAH